MPVTHLDHAILLTRDLASAAAPFEKLGLKLTPRLEHQGGTANRAMFAGSASAGFYVELLAVTGEAAARASGRAGYLDALDAGTAFYRVMVAVEGVGAIAGRLRSAGIQAPVREAFRADGSKICDVASLPADRFGCEVGLIEYTETAAQRGARHASQGNFDQGFPLKRLDHLAAIVHGLDSVCAAWEVLGVPVYGEVRGRGMVIRQLKMGDAILELIGGDTPDSPLNQRPPGLIAMCAFEVPDLQAAVALARERGFTCPDVAAGVLPGTRTATIPGDQLAGMSLQLVEYV